MLLSWLLVLIAISASHEFAFFPDAALYMGEYGYFQSNWHFHRWTLQNLAIPPWALSIPACLGLAYIARRYSLYVTAVFLHPYSLLLVFNFTKEQLLFIVMMSVYALHKITSASWATLVLAAAVACVLVTWRPVYTMFFVCAAVVLVVNQRSRLLVYLLGLSLICGAFIFLAEDLMVLYESLTSRSGIPHTGRDFFSGQCSSERENIAYLPLCWLAFITGLSFHADMLTVNGLILLTFTAIYLSSPMYLAKYFGAKSWSVVVAYIVSHILIFWWGPTAGAYVRYAIPLSWFIAFVCMIQSRTQIKCAPTLIEGNDARGRSIFSN